MSKSDIIVNYIKENSENGTFKNGDKLPTEKELAEKFSLSRNSVRKALKSLEADNYITSRQGSGSYISYKKEDNYIVIAINEEKILDICGYAERKIINFLKEKITDKGFVPLVHLTNQFMKPTKPIPVERRNIKGYISLMNNYLFSPDIYFENIPVVNSLTHAELDYPGVILDYKSYLIEIEKIIENYNIKKPVIFSFNEGDNITYKTEIIQYLINKYFEKKWFLKTVVATSEMDDAANVFEKVMTEENYDCVIFFDDTILKGASKIFSKYKKLEEMKIITLSNEDIILPGIYKVARISYDLNYVAEKSVDLLIDLINNKPITKFIYTVTPKVISNF